MSSDRFATDAEPTDIPGWDPCSHENNAFILHVGTIWQRTTEGVREYAFRVGKVHCNQNDSAHGGMIATFADFALGHAALLSNERRAIATVHLAINFVGGARLNDVIQCRVDLIRKTRSLFFMRGDLAVDTRRIATADGLWKIMGA
jgi:acyl-coenzyme A thioesterase PaaI-like protein